RDVPLDAPRAAGEPRARVSDVHRRPLLAAQPAPVPDLHAAAVRGRNVAGEYRAVGMRRRTKIVATIGPASRDPEVLARMVEAGMDVARLNFSHGSAEEHAETARLVREAAG